MVVVPYHRIPNLDFERQQPGNIGAELLECRSAEPMASIRTAADSDGVLTCLSELTPDIFDSFCKRSVTSDRRISMNDIRFPTPAREYRPVTLPATASLGNDLGEERIDEARETGAQADAAARPECRTHLESLRARAREGNGFPQSRRRSVGLNRALHGACTGLRSHRAQGPGQQQPCGPREGDSKKGDTFGVQSWEHT